MAEKTISVDSMDTMLSLFGSYDENINLIQREYDVVVLGRGEDIKITGEEHGVFNAGEAINGLITMIKKGEKLDEQTIRYVFALVREGRQYELNNLSDDGICVTVTGKVIKPKTLGQKRYVDFIRKGIAFCHGNPSHGVLLTGINPSGNGGANVFYTFRGAKDDPPSRYWEHKKKQIVGKIEELIDKTAYLDLFPYFESSQDTFEETIRPHIDFQVKVLEITQTIIEEYIRPRLIIAANAKAAYYWGFRPDSTWLGYDYIKVDNVPECLRNTKIQLYRINPDNGFRNVSDRVGQDRYHISNIKGAYFIPYAMYDDRHNSSCPEKVLTPEIVMNLIDWINQQE